ncbi:MAG: PadR family transcriptional regulator [Methanosarcinales archaeon]|nr:MAG: PadR family transcriptional regulator [Methanosarcinales archaeon]
MPRYGYEIEKTIEERNMRNWTEIGFFSIYYVLKKLEEKELIRSKVEVVENKPHRKVCTVTDDVMRENVKQLLSSFKRVISAFDLSLINLVSVRYW